MVIWRFSLTRSDHRWCCRANFGVSVTLSRQLAQFTHERGQRELDSLVVAGRLVFTRSRIRSGQLSRSRLTAWQARYDCYAELLQEPLWRGSWRCTYHAYALVSVYVRCRDVLDVPGKRIEIARELWVRR